MKKTFLLFTFTLLVFPLFSLNAQSVDLLWQGETYTHPFYKGRALWSNQSAITMVAIPQGLGNTANLNYRWSKNGTVLGLVSGVGKNTLSFMDTVFSKPVNIKVEIINSQDRVLAAASALVAPQAPFILIYEKNPLYGYMFHHESGEVVKLDKNEITFSAFPFFATPAVRHGGNLMYSWRTNSGEEEKNSSVTYRIPEEGRGASRVTVTLTNQDKIMLPVTREFLIQFGEENE